jgi:uncharacterized protein (TIRG00374 family)
MRKFVTAVVILLAVIFVVGRIAEVEAILATLRSGDWRFLLLACLLMFAWLINLAASYRTIYLLLGLDEPLRKLILLSTAANSINVIAPSGGMGGLAIFIAHARQRGYSSGRATVAGVLVVLFDYLGLLIALTLGLSILFRLNHLNWIDVIASLILLAFAVGLFAILYLAMHSAERLGKLLAWGVRTINRALHLVSKRQSLSEEYAHQFSRDAAAGMRQLRSNPANLWKPAALALSSKGFQLAILFLASRAFQVDIPVDILLAGFSTASLFVIVSPTPYGVGVVEGILTLTLSSLGVPVGGAAVVALSYRAITFWLPLLLGVIAFRLLPKGERESRMSGAETPVLPQ